MFDTQIPILTTTFISGSLYHLTLTLFTYVAKLLTTLSPLNPQSQLFMCSFYLSMLCVTMFVIQNCLYTAS